MVVYADAFDFLAEDKSSYDAVVLDLTDPIGECAKLFTAEFFKMVAYRTEIYMTLSSSRLKLITQCLCCRLSLNAYLSANSPVNQNEYLPAVIPLLLESDGLGVYHAIKCLD